MSNPRILIIENSLDFTGGLRAVLNSSQALRKEFDFLFLLPSGSRSAAYVEEQGFPVFFLPMKELSKNLWGNLIYIPFLIVNAIRLGRLVSAQQVNLIVSNDFYNMLPPVYRLFGGRVLYFCYVRFLPSRFPSLLLRAWFGAHASQAAAIFAVSAKVKSELPAHPGVMVLYDGMGIAPVTDAWVEKRKVFLYLSNYIPGKGQEYAVRSFALLRDEFPDWKLRFAGGDLGRARNKRFKSYLIDLGERLGCASRIEWCDFAEDIRAEFEDAAIVLNFSESESFSLTTLEALYYSRPVIAADSGGPGEIIDDNETGIIVPRGDVDAMAIAMRRLMSETGERRRMGMLGRQRVMQRFGPANTFDLLRSHLLTCLTGKNFS